MAPRRDEERELQELLRYVAIVVILGLMAALVLVVLATPFLSDRSPDTTLLLGLFGSLVGAMLALFGAQVVINAHKKNGDGS